MIAGHNRANPSRSQHLLQGNLDGLSCHALLIMSVKTFTNLLNEGLDLYHAGKFQEGYELMTSNAGHVPRNDAQVYDYRASMACRAGHPELAMELLAEAVMEKDCWYAQEYLEGDDDIAPVARLPAFARLKEVCAEREREARAASTADLVLAKAPSRDEHAPIVIVLHGNAQNVPICQEDWRGVLEEGFDLAFVRSSQLTFSDAYVWNDLEKGARDLGEKLDALRAMGELDGRPLIMAGFSAGARMVLRAVIDAMIDADALVLIGPWLPEIDEWSGTIRSMGERMPGTCIICGDRDDCLPGAQALADALGIMGRPCRFLVPAGLGHDYPPDFASDLSKAVTSFINGRGQGRARDKMTK